MSVGVDSSSLGAMANDTVNNSEVFLIAQRLSSEANAALYELDEYEAISMVFLLLDVENLARHGFKYCQFISNGRTKEAMDYVISIEQRINGSAAMVSVIEGLYIIGRYDLLEDRLGLSVDNNFRRIFSGKIDRDKKALYIVFAGLPQEEADRIRNCRLAHWFCPELGRPLEETFARNLNNIGNCFELYNELISELYNALMDENKESLAEYIRHIPRPLVVTSSPERLPIQTATETYPLPLRYPHGLCIIINVKSFIKPMKHDDLPLHERHGSDIDKNRLAGTFKLFGFHVVTLDNPVLEQIHQYFKSLRVSPNLACASCLAVCIMTHGDEDDQIYLHDRTCLSVTDMRRLCFSQALLNKPRLYFIQACRGERAMQPIFLQLDESSVTHVESDCLISAATVKGYSAVRSQNEGSWYITDLCQALQEYGHRLPIKNVLQKARQTLKARVDTMNNTFVTQLSEDKTTLVKDVQLVRADEEHFLEGIIDLAQLEVIENVLEDQLEEELNRLERQGLLANMIERFKSLEVV